MAFHNVPPNGFPDIPDIEDLEAVQGDITALKTGKAPKTDIAANFSDTANYAVGDLVYKDGVLYECINAHEAAAWAAGDFTVASVGSAISGVNSNFIGLDVDINAPDRKNLLPMTLEGIKAINSGGTWTDNVFVYKGVTYTVNLDASGNVTSITAEGTADASGSTCALCSQSTSYIRQELNGKTLTYSGCPSGGSEQTYNLYGWKVTTGETGIRDTGNGVTFNAINMNSSFNFAVIIGASYAIPSGGLTFYPMLRLSTISDSTFAPYIPSVESRIEAVESASGVYVTADKSYEYTVNANAGTNITASDFNITTPAGYTPVAFSRVVTGSDDVIIRNMSPMKTGSTTMLGLYNTSGSAVTATAIVNVMYVKTGAVS